MALNPRTFTGKPSKSISDYKVVADQKQNKDGEILSSKEMTVTIERDNIPMETTNGKDSPLLCELLGKRCDGLQLQNVVDNESAPTPVASFSPEGLAVGELTIRLEKRLCAILGKEWSAAGISVHSLCSDVEKLLKQRRDALKLAQSQLYNMGAVENNPIMQQIKAAIGSK